MQMNASSMHHKYLAAGVLGAGITGIYAGMGQAFGTVFVGLVTIGAFILAGSLNQRRYDENKS